MFDQPLVFVRCLTYNHEAYIEDALNGFVMQQTNFPYVVTIVNDASPDNTKQVLDNYIKENCILDNVEHTHTDYADIISAIPTGNTNCLLYILNLHENHFGKKSHRPYYQHFVEKAKYWAECDGDDYWINPHKLQKQVDFMEENEDCGLCYTDFNICNHSGDLIERSYFTEGKHTPILSFREHLLRQGYIAPMTWMYRNSVYDSFKNRMLTGIIDGSYVAALEFFANSKVLFIPMNTANYRRSFDSATRPTSQERLFRYRKDVYDIEKEYAKRYLSTDSSLLMFIQYKEMLELYPMALKVNNLEYIKFCQSLTRENNMYDLSLPFSFYSLEKSYNQIQTSYAYRLGKIILKPFSWLRKIFMKKSDN